MPDPKTQDKNNVPSSEAGYVTEKDKTPQSGHGGTGTATGTAPQNPGTTQQNPGTSGKNTDVTGDATERSIEGKSEAGEPIRNPSGDALGDAIDGDEGSGKRI